jgi:hypothetical protein
MRAMNTRTVPTTWPGFIRCAKKTQLTRMDSSCLVVCTVANSKGARAADYVNDKQLFNKHSGNVQRIFRQRSTNIQGTFNEHSGNVQRTFRERSTNIQGIFGHRQRTFRTCSGNVQQIFRAHSGNSQGTFVIVIVRQPTESFKAHSSIFSLG